MSDKKRSSNLAISPKKLSTDKRRKDEKENDSGVLSRPSKQAKQLKTKYKFAPGNSLISNTPLKPITLDPNVPKDQQRTVSTTPSKHLAENHHPESPSSEDYVFWASTPKFKSNAIPQTKSSDSKRQIPSSPLQDLITTAPINPISRLPQKFQSINFDNFSQRSPEALRNPIPKSESFPSYEPRKRQLSSNIKPKKLYNPFTIASTPNTSYLKKNDITNLINTVESAFSANGSDIKSNLMKLRAGITDETPSKLKDSDVIPKQESAEVETPLKFDMSSDILDDDFSEDFLDDLDKVLERKTQHSQKEGDSQESTTSKELDEVVTKLSQKNIIEEKGEAKQKLDSDMDGDSFDDDFDDDMFDQLLDKRQTQAPSAAPAVVVPPITYAVPAPAIASLAVTQTAASTTQEKNIQKVDREGHLIFKRDIDGTDVQKIPEFKQTEENLAKCAVEREGLHRFQVTEVLESCYFQNKVKKNQKIITVIDSKNQSQKIVVRDLWVKLDIQPKDVIHVVGKTFKIVDKNSDNLLIWNPDLLLSATLIGDTISCARRSVLKTRLTFRGEYNKPLIVGEIVHCIFQSVLKDRDCSIEFMDRVLEDQLDIQNLNILTIEESKETIREEVRLHTPYIKSWYELYVKERPVNSSSVRVSAKQEKTLFSTSNVLDIEENIWSPMYGLRGLIDVTIEAYLKDSTKDGKFIAPLELKSGARAQISHKAQAALYTLLMKDRYDMDVGFFMLVYTKMKETTKYELDVRELKELIMVRNQLSTYLKEGVRELPPLKQESICDNCFTLDACMTYNKLTEAGTAEESGLVDGVYDDLTGHLDNIKYSEFFSYWDDLITKEESTINLLKKDLFLIDSETREKTSGKCLSHLVIKDSQDNDSEENEKFIYTFVRKDKAGLPLNVSQLAKHDRILVSDEAGHFALCSGYVLNVWPTEIIISTTRRLESHNLKIDGFDVDNNQTYQTFLRPLAPTQHLNESISYRLDKDDMFHGMKLARFNILNLFLKDGDDRRRELIVDGVAPKFNKKPLKYNLDEHHSFNEDQIRAFDKVLSANDFSLLLGMPGTGKTTVIAQLIRFLVQNKKTVLLTSYTHSAVDNILMKIKDDGIGIIRLGNLSRIHPEVQKFSPYNREIKTNKDLNEVFLDPPVVATTCLGISDWIFNRRKFDYCIVDESSQVSMPVCIGPLAFCDKFVLVGDHYQLPPLVQNPDAKAGLSKSLFKMLSDSYPDAVVDLTYQYRMCSDIMLLTNTIIYEGRLKCGSESVANQSLMIPHIEKLQGATAEDAILPEHKWLENILDPSKKVLFLNHDNVGGCQESKSKENIENHKEALLIYQIVEAMLCCGVPEESIGVMSFYRAQLRAFYKLFSERKKVEMLTADQFQGRDKECVIISLVKSNDRNDAGSLLKEWRRVNVAITRAKSKLIIVGSKKTLQSLKTIDAFMKILASRGWFYDLPPKAETFYSFQPPVKSFKSSAAKVKPFKDSKVLQRSQLGKEIAEESGL